MNLRYFGTPQPHSEPRAISALMHIIGDLADQVSSSSGVSDIDECHIRAHLMDAYFYIERVALAQHN
jgi:hypothetical protein